MVDTFQGREDIANRALQICRSKRITSFTDTSKNAQEVSLCYDKLRVAELRRNVWTFACRRTRLWPISTTTLQFLPPAYATGTTYQVGDIVTSGGTTWVSKQAANLGNTPGADISGLLWWDVYFGALMAQYWNLPINPPTANSVNTSYDAGEIVYIITGPGTYNVYRSALMGNTQQPNMVDAWNSAPGAPVTNPAFPMYSVGDVVSYNGINYQSLVNFNYNNEPDTSPTYWTTTITKPLVSNSWKQMASATLAPLVINWPLNSGPAEDVNTKNAFMLPSGFQREAPQSPGAGRYSAYLGFPRNLRADDWERDGNFLVSGYTTTIEYRFVADVQDVSTMDAMFCEGLAAKIAMSVAGVLVSDEQRASVVKEAMIAFGRSMAEARIANGIEQGPIMPPLDDYIACRN